PLPPLSQQPPPKNRRGSLDRADKSWLRALRGAPRRGRARPAAAEGRLRFPASPPGQSFEAARFESSLRSPLVSRTCPAIVSSRKRSAIKERPLLAAST